MSQQHNRQTLVYIGTYTDGDSEGIYVYRMDVSSGSLEFASKAVGIDNPTFLAIDPRRRYLYSISEVAEFAGQESGVVSAFSIYPGTGELTFLNNRPSRGAGACHLSVDATGRYVLVANYNGGSVAVLPIQDDGRLDEATSFIQHEGSSVNPARQDGPYAHSITLDAANRYAFVADLGLDKIMVYRLDLEQGRLIPHDEPWVKVRDGAGPRHFAFHPGGKYAYAINELDSSITAFTYHETAGRLREIQMVSTIPTDYRGTNHCADVHVSASGRFVYGSNRGHDSIAIFAIDENTGRLTRVANQPTEGKTPRNFAIDPSGRFLLAANQDSDTIVTFRIDTESGKLEPTGHVAQVPSPVCLKVIDFES